MLPVAKGYRFIGCPRTFVTLFQTLFQQGDSGDSGSQGPLPCAAHILVQATGDQINGYLKHKSCHTVISVWGGESRRAGGGECRVGTSSLKQGDQEAEPEA